VTGEKQTAGWDANLYSLPVIDQAVLIALANGLPPMAKETLTTLTRLCGEGMTISKVRASLSRLRNAGVLSKSGSTHMIEDKLFAAHIKKIFCLV